MISLRLAFEAESYRVGSDGFELHCSRHSFPDHRRYELFDEYGEVEVDVVMNSVEMHLPIIAVLVRVEVAAPEVEELENGSKAQLLVEVENMLPSRSLSEFPPELFEFRFLEQPKRVPKEVFTERYEPEPASVTPPVRVAG